MDVEKSREVCKDSSKCRTFLFTSPFKGRDDIYKRMSHISCTNDK